MKKEMKWSMEGLQAEQYAKNNNDFTKQLISVFNHMKKHALKKKIQ